MAFQSNTLVNGEWTTRTLDVDTVLRHLEEREKEHARGQAETEKTPKFGLLTQTIVRSPIAHWILPVRLRSIKFHDVAIIGDDFVEIKELRSDGLLWDVIRKDDFGARIRNATVIGTICMKGQGEDAEGNVSQANSDYGNIGSAVEDTAPRPDSVPTRSLPPQFLVLQIETGDSVFMMLQPNDLGELHFEMSTYRVPKPMIDLQAGIHLTVDPTSRYMAVGSSENMLVVYELQTRAVLEKQFAEGRKLKHVAACTTKIIFDAILKMAFLYPSPGCKGPIMLLVLVSQRFKTRMIYYEWEPEQDMDKIQPSSMTGHQLVSPHSVPLLLIPLKFQSAIMLVCEDSMCVYNGIAANAPVCETFGSEPIAPSPYYNGSSRPLWTSWARPARNIEYWDDHDSIYIVREDGKLKSLMFDKDLGVEYNIVGDFDASCGTSFACLDFDGSNHKTGDVFVSGGDACSGGSYLLQARTSQEFKEPIQNWTPAQDFVTTYDAKVAGTQGKAALTKELIPKPERVFVCTGKGEGAAVTELRHGLEAKIGYSASFDDLILQVWALPSGFQGDHALDSTYVLLSSGNTSSLLFFEAKPSEDPSEMKLLGEDSTSLDLDHRTITVSIRNQSVIQVTEKSIRIIGPDFVRKYDTGTLAGMIGDSIDNAYVSDGTFLFTAYVNSSVYLQVLELKLPENSMDVDEIAHVRTLCTLPSSITSLIIGEVGQRQYAIIAEWSETSISLSFQPISGGERHEMNLQGFLDCERLGAVGSLLILDCLGDTFLLLGGTRNGLLITLEISIKTLETVEHRIDRIGSTSVLLTVDTRPECEYNFFISCDSKLYHSRPHLSGRSKFIPRRWHKQPHQIRQVWLSDAAQPYLCQPSISTFTQLCRTANRKTNYDNRLLLISESEILVASLSTDQKIVPGRIKIKGTPSRLLFSPAINALVVAVSIDGKSSLQFLDPETGEDLSQPIDQTTKEPVDFVSGLGHENEKIWALYEWKFTKDTTTWYFIIAATSTGRVLMISIDRSNAQMSDASHDEPRKIRYYTRYKFRSQSKEPVFSVTGFPQGLLWCAGTKLYCDVLDLVKKKFVKAAEYDLPSPALSLEYSDGVVYALTKAHSLELLKLTLDNSGHYHIVRTHGDQLTRDALHHIVLEASPGNALHLLSDKQCSLTGLYPVSNTKADTLDTVFEAELSHSILRFRSARCRPIWDDSWNDSEAMATNGSVSVFKYQPDILGLSIMGSLSHFTLLDYKTWRYLRFIVDLAIRSKDICRFTYKEGLIPDDTFTEPKATRMQIDGDILRRCLEGGHLDKLLLMGQNTPYSRRLFERFCALLLAYHDGKIKKGSKPEFYIDQAYADLGFFLRPVL